MKTITVQIGNSDDKLSQKEWSEFHLRISGACIAYAAETHFSGTSNGEASWQNACFIFDCEDSDIEELRMELSFIRSCFGQESIALMEGETEFI